MSCVDQTWKEKSGTFRAQLDQIKNLQDALNKANDQLELFSANDNEKNATTQKIIDMFAKRGVTEYVFIKDFQELVLKIRKREANYEAILNDMRTEEAQNTFIRNHAMETVRIGDEIPSLLGPYTNYFKQVSDNNAGKSLDKPCRMAHEMFGLMQALFECHQLAFSKDFSGSYDHFLKYLNTNNLS